MLTDVLLALLIVAVAVILGLTVHPVFWLVLILLVLVAFHSRSRRV